MADLQKIVFGNVDVLKTICEKINNNVDEINARIQRGSGSPEGIITAGYGTSYEDSDSGNTYVKTTNTTAYGWKLIPTKEYVDSAIDDINSDIDSSYPFFAKPLTVLSGNYDTATGYSDIINKISDTEVSFKVGGTYKNLVITDSECKKYEISSIANVTLSTDAGTYIFLIDFTNMTLLGNGTYSAIATIGINVTEGQTLPASPIDGDYNVLINEMPYSPQKRISGAWVDREFVKIGEANRATALGVLGTPRSYAFNGKYISDAFATTTYTLYTRDANIGSDCNARFRSVCVIATAGYTVGSYAYAVSADGGSGVQYPYNVIADSKGNILSLRVQSGLLAFSIDSSAVVDMRSANFKLQLIAERSW